MSNVWYVDLLDRSPVVSKYEERYLNADLKDHETDNAIDLQDWDWRIFKSMTRAERFVAAYCDVLDNLDAYCRDKGAQVPHMLYKRRYLVLTLLGIKRHTVRSYLRPWKPGQLVNLHDQTHFLTVRITSIEDLGDGEWKYNFELARDPLIPVVLLDEV